PYFRGQPLEVLAIPIPQDGDEADLEEAEPDDVAEDEALVELDESDLELEDEGAAREDGAQS
ncbi:MAG: hypothetical protein K0V04_13035, partial [Deltaproteobacteria bacterium]|nr:hypothetical protein [Deltaproteobacteria bacterium]